MIQNLNSEMTGRLGKPIADASNEEIYMVLLELVKEHIHTAVRNEGKKKVYYISAEFLIGKLLSNNLINLGMYEEVDLLLKEKGKSLSEIEEVEPEPSLGNGGLGRLAACFLDSIATLGLNGDGIGLNYHFGLFKQVFENQKQKEIKNPWIDNKNWLNETGIGYKVPYRDFTLVSKLYDIDITGYENRSNKLHLFDVETVDECLVRDGISFDKEDIGRNLTLFLYPDDSDKDGNLLRIYQQYFMVSNAAQLILSECEQKGYDLHKLHDHVVIQINDTHPSMIIPELIRLLLERGMSMDEAITIVSAACAYTNHTILAEALEKWPLAYLDQVVPHLIPIIKELDARVRKKFADERVFIIDRCDRVHMAHMDIHYGFSVNGVAALHTEILKESELRAFYDIYPEKFNNKTNGITFRRWLLHCNRDLASYIESLIGSGFKKDACELEKLLDFKEDQNVRGRLMEIKKDNKRKLADYVEETSGIRLDENSIFDIQIKRLHEYKRQQMNALYIVHKFLEIKKGKYPATPITMIFGAKAAPAYTIAKDIIHFILCLQEVINHDPQVSPHLKVVMIENYNVSAAEKLIPACDVSEQISLASKEASGTGNMKFMLNGAVTLGTMDGANVEIEQLVGEDNMYVFGESSMQVIEHYNSSDYKAVDYYINDPEIKEMVDFILSPEILSVGDVHNLLRLHTEIVGKDWFMTLLDVKDYILAKDRMFRDYENKEKWSRMVLVNIAKAGFFSSDRTILQYNSDIWKL